MSTFTIFVILIIFVAFLLVTVIMVQNPQGGGLSASFGGGQQMGGVKKTSDFLDKSTWTLAIILLALILLSNISLMTSGTNAQSDLFDNNDVIPTQTIPAQTDADIDATLNTDIE